MTTGKQKNDFPGAFIPFDKSVGPVPTVPIDSFPTVQFCVNEDWLPYVVTCLKALARPETWDDTYQNAVIAASEFAALIGNIQDGCGVDVPGIGCFSGSFLDLDYGFEPQAGAFCVSSWVSGTGWQGCCDSTPQAFLNIKREFGSTTIIRAVSVVIKVTAPYLVNYSVKLKHGGTYTIIASDTAVTGPTIVVDVTGLSEPAESLWIDVIEPLGGCGADPVVTDFSICYTGAFPVSVTPDRWVHTFDFTVNDGGWSAADLNASGSHGSGVTPGAYYSAGNGWVCPINHLYPDGSPVNEMGIFITPGPTYTLTRQISTISNPDNVLPGGTIYQTTGNHTGWTTGTHDYDASGLFVGTRAFSGADGTGGAAASGGHTVTIRKVVLFGVGTDPF